VFFVTQKQCVFCEVETKVLYIIIHKMYVLRCYLHWN
jgi:hypothetical protein